MFRKLILAAAVLVGGAALGTTEASAGGRYHDDFDGRGRYSARFEGDYGDRHFDRRPDRVVVRHVYREDYRPRSRVVVKHVVHKRHYRPRARLVIKHVYRDRPRFATRHVVKHVYRY